MNELSTIFETKIWNRRREPVHVRDSSGRMVCFVLPDQIEIVESITDKTLYARYSELIFEENGAVSLTVRPNWVEPYYKEPCLLILENVDGKELEERVIGGKAIYIPKGIPVRVWVDSTDPLAVNERITITRVSERVKCRDWPGYYILQDAVKDVPTPRPQKDLDKIAEVLGKGTQDISI